MNNQKIKTTIVLEDSRFSVDVEVTEQESVSFELYQEGFKKFASLSSQIPYFSNWYTLVSGEATKLIPVYEYVLDCTFSDKPKPNSRTVLILGKDARALISFYNTHTELCMFLDWETGFYRFQTQIPDDAETAIRKAKTLYECFLAERKSHANE